MIERVLVVGLGSIGKRHLQIVRDLNPFADIRILRHTENIEKPEASNGCFKTIEEVTDFLPQIAVIANPAPFHISIAMTLVNIGCHLLIEKPISNNTNGIKNLIEIAQKNNVLIQLGYNLRFYLSLANFRRYIHDGRVGRILSIRSEVGQFLPTWRSDLNYHRSVSAKKELGGGVLLELSHEIDYLRWIFGEVKKVGAILSKNSDLKIDVEDSAFLNLQFSSANNYPGPIASLCMDFIRHDKSRRCLAIGSLGTLRWNGNDGIVECWKSGGEEWEKLFQDSEKLDNSYLTEWKHFLNCVYKNEMPCVTAEDGLAVMKIIQAAHISNAASGKSIDVLN